MRQALLGLVAVVCLTAFAPAPLPRREPRGKTDSLAVAHLVGSYRATRLVSAGNTEVRAPASSGVSHVTITATQWVFNKPQNNPVEYELRIDHLKQPAEINLYHKGQGGGAPYGLGIIRRENGKLRIIYTWGGNRPTSFENPHAGCWDLTLQRE